MSDDRLARVEDKLDGVVATQAPLTRQVGTLVEGQATLTVGLEEVRTHLIRVDKRLDRLEVGQEQMRDDIKQIAEGHAVTQAAIARSTETVIAHIDKRIDPLEKAVRAHFDTR